MPVSTEATSQLLIEHCDHCAHWVHPAAGTCRDCGAALVAKPVSGQGTVFTYTVNYHAFNPEIATPYVIALVELDEQSGLKVAANIVDCEPDSVTMRHARRGPAGTGPRWRGALYAGLSAS